MVQWVRVALDVPLPGLFDYAVPDDMPVQVGLRVRVPFGAKELIGVIVEQVLEPEVQADKVKTVLQVITDLPALPASWMVFAQFASRYYQRPLGEVILPAMPVGLRRPVAYTSVRANGGPVARLDAKRAKAKPTHPTPSSPTPVTLNSEQQDAVQAIVHAQGYQTFLLYGITGSGKTQVYLEAAKHVLAQGKQVLFLVPEINLTPQFETVLRNTLAEYVHPHEIAVLHSGLSDGERIAAWVDAARGQAKVVLGTRLSIFAPLENMGLIIIDEEHDPSYKQQDGLRYSARDLAVWRAHQLKIPLVLGSATPSLETWNHAQKGDYLTLKLSQKAVAHSYQAQIELVNIKHQKLIEGLSQPVIEAIRDGLEKKQQALVFINRRGYAPVLQCPSCGWGSECPRCSAYMVLHKRKEGGYCLQCHHCGLQTRIPTICPECGNQDLQPLGRGTQKIEEYLNQCFPQANILRIDADSARGKGKAGKLFDQVHTGDVDILVGTQMVSKGHDFKRLNLVCIINADASLYSQDFRATERLFAQLLQVAGRAGRHLTGGKVLLQTQQIEHPIFQAVQQYSFEQFANSILAERRLANLPPYSHLALLTAQSRKLETVLQFLKEAKALTQSPDLQPYLAYVMLYDAVPLRIVRVNKIERAQLLIESKNRQVLQRFLPLWLEKIRTQLKTHRVQYIIEVDPLEI